jgi:hypothetical protein
MKRIISVVFIFFPSAREVLHEAKAFNDKKNSAIPVSFDQILNSRRFNSVIYKKKMCMAIELSKYMKITAPNQLLE